MICVLALVVFAVLGVFSARYRKIAAEAFDCVFRRITFRKCTTGLDARLKSQISGALHRKHPKMARHLFKRFEIYSWILLILLIASLGYSIYGGYNYIVYGNCNGEDSDIFCVYDAIAGGSEVSEIQDGLCAVPVNVSEGDLTPPDVLFEDRYGNPTAELTLIEFGCYACPYTRKAQPAVEKILANYNGRVNLVYLDFLLPQHPESKTLSQAVYCADKQDKKWEFHFEILKGEEIPDLEDINDLVSKYNLNKEEFDACMQLDAEPRIQLGIEKGVASGVYGTPTFFINEKSVVGPRPYNYFKNIINDELNQD
jgi:hypothetical protein